MKVYELFRDRYEGDESIGIFATLDGAMNSVDAEWKVDEVWPPGYGKFSAYGIKGKQVFYIEEREVKE